MSHIGAEASVAAAAADQQTMPDAHAFAAHASDAHAFASAAEEEALPDANHSAIIKAEPQSEQERTGKKRKQQQ